MNDSQVISQPTAVMVRDCEVSSQARHLRQCCQCTAFLKRHIRLVLLSSAKYHPISACDTDTRPTNLLLHVMPDDRTLYGKDTTKSAFISLTMCDCSILCHRAATLKDSNYDITYGFHLPQAPLYLQLRRQYTKLQMFSLLLTTSTRGWGVTFWPTFVNVTV